MGAAITGIGTALPERELPNSELAERLDISEEWIVERTGVRTRRVVRDGQTALTLGTDATVQALARANLDAEEIDTIIVATCTPRSERRAPGRSI